MTTLRSLVLVAIVLLPAWAAADDWMSPVTTTTYSASGAYRVTVVPRAPAGKDQPPPFARVERFAGPNQWRLVWQQNLVNEVAPVTVLLANDASHLVTFDNWHAVGYGADVVVIYDRRGELVRKLSLEQILAPEQLRQVPMSVSSRWWGGKHRLVEGDRTVELQVVKPRANPESKPAYAPVRIRLADGVRLPR